MIGGFVSDTGTFVSVYCAIGVRYNYGFPAFETPHSSPVEIAMHDSSVQLFAAGIGIHTLAHLLGGAYIYTGVGPSSSQSQRDSTQPLCTASTACGRGLNLL